MTNEPSSYVIEPPRLKITATYPATDGRVPEAIEIECDQEGVEGSDFLDRAVTALARVAAHRDDPYQFATGGPVTAAGAGLPRTLTISPPADNFPRDPLGERVDMRVAGQADAPAVFDLNTVGGPR